MAEMARQREAEELMLLDGARDVIDADANDESDDSNESNPLRVVPVRMEADGKGKQKVEPEDDDAEYFGDAEERPQPMDED